MSATDWIYAVLGALALWFVVAPLIGGAVGKILKFCGRHDSKGDQK